MLLGGPATPRRARGPTRTGQLKRCYDAFCREHLSKVADGAAKFHASNTQLTQLHRAGKLSAAQYVKRWASGSAPAARPPRSSGAAWTSARTTCALC
jgi:hypothetical protein